MSAGLSAKTKAPVPVSSVTALRRLALDGVPKNVATPAPRLVIPVPPLATGNVPVTPVVRGKPVAFVNVALDGVPSAGVTNVGDVANTNAPEPVSPVTAAARFAELGVARNVSTPVPRPVTPVEIGRPVAFVSVAADGVPKSGVVSAGLVANTNAPEPVSPVTAAAKLAEDGVARNVATPVPRPDTPVAIGSPVAFVRVADAGVPNVGVTSVGLLDKTTPPVPVEVVTPVPPLATAKVPARVIVPVEVIGPPLVVKPVVPPDTATLVTPSGTLLETLTKSVPFHAISARSPFAIVIPVVGPTPTTLTPKPPVVSLMTA